MDFINSVGVHVKEIIKLKDLYTLKYIIQWCTFAQYKTHIFFRFDEAVEIMMQTLTWRSRCGQYVLSKLETNHQHTRNGKTREKQHLTYKCSCCVYEYVRRSRYDDDDERKSINFRNANDVDTHLSLHNQSDCQCNWRIVGEFWIIWFHFWSLLICCATF